MFSTITKILGRAIGTAEADFEKLENTLRSQAHAGLTVKQALSGHLPIATPEAINGITGQLKNADGGGVTVDSPLLSVMESMQQQKEVDPKQPEQQTKDK